MSRVVGYKAFDNMKDRFGNEYRTDIIYELTGPIKFRKNGFHFCKHIADVFRYYDGFSDDTIVCKVVGYGDLDKFDDENYEYFDMYASSKLKIIKELSREEILEATFKDGFMAILRLISGYKLNNDEIDMILDRYHEPIIEDYINYYQRKNEKAFVRKRS